MALHIKEHVYLFSQKIYLYLRFNHLHKLWKKLPIYVMALLETKRLLISELDNSNLDGY